MTTVHRIAIAALLTIALSPLRFSLEQNYPNPFNPVTIIKYTVGVARGEWQVAEEAGTGSRGPRSRKTRLVVYDVLGRQVATLVDEAKAPGSYEVTFNGTGLASGVYLYRLSAGSSVQTRKMIFMKQKRSSEFRCLNSGSVHLPDILAT